MAKLDAQSVACIKVDIRAGLSQVKIGKKYGVSRSTISDIATGRIYKNVPWPEGKPVPKKAGGQHKRLGEHDPTDKRILELEAEVVHLTQERNRERAKSKASAKTQGLFRAVVDEMDHRIVPYESLPSQIVISPKATITEHCVMHMSDGHHDQVVRAESVGGLEEYNFPISCCRAERYVNTVIDWTQNILAPQFHFPVLWVLAYGDFSSGEIHKACERSYYRNQFKNCFGIGQLHALMYRDLAAHFSQVNVLYLPGNHGRRSTKKDYLGAHDNWDYLVAEVARLHCRDIDNVSFLIPDTWSANIDINGVGFNISHGDDVRSSLSIPWYGLQRRQQRLQGLAPLQSGPRVRYYCIGHFHQKGMVGALDGEMIMNGPWLATDPFSYEGLASYTEPFQWLHGVNRKYGITWRLDVKLRHKNEMRGPQRYLIDGGRDIGPL